MGNSARLLKIVFVILLVVTLGELGYYVYYSKMQPVSDKKVTDTSDKNMPVAYSSTPSAFPTKTFTYEGQVFSDQFLEKLKNEKKDLLISAIITKKYKGEIYDLDTKGGINSINKIPYALIVRIKGDKNSKTGFMYSKENIQKAKIVEIVNDKEVPMDIQELKRGEMVTISESFDYFGECSTKDCTFNVQIIKL